MAGYMMNRNGLRRRDSLEVIFEEEDIDDDLFLNDDDDVTNFQRLVELFHGGAVRPRAKSVDSQYIYHHFPMFYYLYLLVSKPR